MKAILIINTFILILIGIVLIPKRITYAINLLLLIIRNQKQVMDQNTIIEGYVSRINAANEKIQATLIAALAEAKTGAPLSDATIADLEAAVGHTEAIAAEEAPAA